MKKTSLSAAFLLIPMTAHANSFRGLGVLVSAMFAGFPCLVLLVGLVLTTGIFLKGPRPSHPTYARVAVVLSLLAVIPLPVTAWVLEDSFDSSALVFTLMCDAPLALLAVVSILMARRLLRPRP